MLPSCAPGEKHAARRLHNMQVAALQPPEANGSFNSRAGRGDPSHADSFGPTPFALARLRPLRSRARALRGTAWASHCARRVIRIITREMNFSREETLKHLARVKKCRTASGVWFWSPSISATFWVTGSPLFPLSTLCTFCLKWTKGYFAGGFC